MGPDPDPEPYPYPDHPQHSVLGYFSSLLVFILSACQGEDLPIVACGGRG
jgi:hypothetical protein